MKQNDLGLIRVLLIVGALLLTAGGVVALPAVKQAWKKKVAPTPAPRLTATPTPKFELSPAPSPTTFAPGQVLVGLKSEYTQQDLEMIIVPLGLKILKWREELRFATLEVPTGQEKTWVERLSQETIVAWVELNRTMQIETDVSCQTDIDCPPTIGVCGPGMCPTYKCFNGRCVYIRDRACLEETTLEECYEKSGQ